ncbi:MULTISPECIES: LmeA family phospholipid-binding protein [unclassified Modestobacter]
MRTFVVLLLLLTGLLVVADRVGVAVAEDRVADQLVERGGLSGEPEVDITGFPFLTQAVAGRYDEVRIQLTAEELGQPAGTSADVVLRGVEVPLSDVLSGSVQEVPVERVDGTAMLSYELLSEQLGGDTTLAPAADGLQITRTVEVLGAQVPLSATGTLSLDGQVLVVDVEEASAAGVEIPDFVVDRAADLLDFRYSVPELPFGLQLTDVDARDDGVQVQVEATDTVLRG